MIRKKKKKKLNDSTIIRLYERFVTDESLLIAYIEALKIHLAGKVHGYIMQSFGTINNFSKVMGKDAATIRNTLITGNITKLEELIPILWACGLMLNPNIVLPLSKENLDRVGIDRDIYQ